MAQNLFDIFLKYWRRNYGSTRVPIWKPLCSYVRRGNLYNYDLHWLDPYSSKDGLDGVAFYVTKYLLKFDDWIDKFKSKLYFNLSHDDYKDAWSKFRPRILLSKGFGDPYNPLVLSHINKGISLAINSSEAFFPYFISRVNGSTYPLSPYYQKKFLTSSAQLIFCSRRPDKYLDMFDIDDFDKRALNLSLVRSFIKNKVSLSDLDIDDINSFNIENYDISRNPQTIQDFANCWQDS